jgi:uncharacterized integral membrane protein
MKNFFGTIVSNSVKILIGIFLAVSIIFLWQNWKELTAPIEITFIGTAEYPLVFWLGASFVAGVLVWYLISLKSRRLLKKTINTQKNELSNLKSETDKLRNLSLTDDVKTIESVSPEQALPDNGSASPEQILPDHGDQKDQ